LKGILLMLAVKSSRGRLLDALAPDWPGGVDLTLAERVVLGFLLAGLSNKEIASALNKAEPTIKHQVSSILRKHRVPSRARLIALLHNCR
jgi:DNA-binding NarL/FixJ family response regulator